jgi:hypothetical protein
MTYFVDCLPRRGQRCTVRGCSNPVQNGVFGALCASHLQHRVRYGDPEARLINYRRDIKPTYSLWLADGMTKYANTNGMKAGLTIAARLLRYKAPTFGERTKGQELAEHAFGVLRDHGVTPEMLCLRVAEWIAAEHSGRIARDAKRAQWRRQMARSVMRVLPGWSKGQKGWRDFTEGARVCDYVGELLVTELGPWALALMRKLEKDCEEHVELIRGSQDFAA